MQKPNGNVAFQTQKCGISDPEMFIHPESVFSPDHDGVIDFCQKNLFIPDMRFRHLIIFFRNFHQHIRKWGAILIRNVPTFQGLKCHISGVWNATFPLGFCTWVIYRIWVSGFRFLRITTTPLILLQMSPYLNLTINSHLVLQYWCGVIRLNPANHIALIKTLLLLYDWFIF